MSEVTAPDKDLERKFQAKFAIVRRVSSTLVEQALRSDESGGKPDLALAREQHDKYISCLRNLNIDVHEFDSDDRLPDCCFVEDVAVCHDGIALISRPGHPTRREEVDVVRRVLSFDLGQKVVDMAEVEGATLDGGDVLFTGKEFFVGLSKRTNMKGALFLADTFSNYPVSPIKLSDGSLHLKSFMSMAAPEVIAVGSSKEAQKALKEIECKATFTYRKITLPDDGAANCVYVNKTLIHCSHEDFPESVKKFEELFGHTLNRIEMPNSEFKKVDGALTCRSILIQKKPKA
ncbi:N(G),N(G)-dimethylarginine dimethylaminohydrolase 1-like isoform X2 [Lytechinus variegatus]|uniref:N(G),N(G)-dimethylarginine dimethylaminohydrolase 1-like isoform X2 n=1 Tax=Lytechinus variegatus TaxID=7654 RepID=UPI001BB2C825|nr:N(G),N(G)-dimethylarginine dimethylaminohydrolase 1-like isoform X2 [Lytechinus variegatus]